MLLFVCVVNVFTRDSFSTVVICLADCHTHCYAFRMCHTIEIVRYEYHFDDCQCTQSRKKIMSADFILWYAVHSSYCLCLLSILIGTIAPISFLLLNNARDGKREGEWSDCNNNSITWWICKALKGCVIRCVFWLFCVFTISVWFYFFNAILFVLGVEQEIERSRDHSHTDEKSRLINNLSQSIDRLYSFVKLWCLIYSTNSSLHICVCGAFSLLLLRMRVYVCVPARVHTKNRCEKFANAIAI